MLHTELNFFSSAEPRTALEQDLFAARVGESAHRCAYVSKMFAVSRGDLPEAKRKELTADEMRQRGREARERAQAMRDALQATGASVESHNGQLLSGPVEDLTDEQKKEEIILGFARLYSGTLRVGESINVVMPKYDTSKSPEHPFNAKYLKSATIESLYMMMGRDLVSVTEVPAGNVFAMRGLEGVVVRNATLCGLSCERTDKLGMEDIVNLAGLNKLSSPIVRVALEPKNPSNMPKLVEGLRLLNQADPCVETMVQSTGEHVIVCAGELHLEVRSCTTSNVLVL